jgi:hypothetical protein
MKLKKLFIFVSAISFLMACDSVLGPTETYEVPPRDRTYEDGPWILVDHYHTRKQNPEDYRLKKGDYAYQGTFGFYRVFQHLERNKYHWSSVRELPLSTPRLKDYDALFINLVHDDRPDFSDDEVTAILNFVREGGGLFVIADHTNVYKHAERINRFLIPMGLEVLYHTAVDFPPMYSVAGLGWIMVWDFADHPVSEGLKMVSLQTGGPQVGGTGIGYTSDRSFGDLWDPTDDFGYYGNWSYDGDPEVEPQGPLQVISAAEFGEGRVVVVGDQNIFGDAWAHFGDNFELAMNIFEWTTGREDSKPALRDLKPRGTLFTLDTAHNDFSAGKASAEHRLGFYVNLNRDPDITARAVVERDPRSEVLFVLNPSTGWDENELAELREHLDDGKKLVVTFEANDANKSVRQVLKELDPELEIPDVTGEIDQPLAVSSEHLDVAGITVASYRTKGDEVEPYLLDLSTDWGEPFLWATHAERRIDIARRLTWPTADPAQQGELIIFFQDGFWRNRTLGDYMTPHKSWNDPAHELQFRLMDYLKAPGQD